mmetsp:Transcript_29419/g.45286  ORF Transcript_29419/g.45286 Transcript_29419/m.45286 type:complete len:80 (+) Transcript_29419:30-269(+)
MRCTRPAISLWTDQGFCFRGQGDESQERVIFILTSTHENQRSAGWAMEQECLVCVEDIVQTQNEVKRMEPITADSPSSP